MSFFVEIDEDNHVPLANGEVLVWMRHSQKNRSMDWLKQIFYPDYDLSSSLLGEDGALVFVRDKHEKVLYDPLGIIREKSGQLGEQISVEETSFTEAGGYRVLSRKGNTIVSTDTWLPNQENGVVREFRVSTVKGNATEVSIYPTIHLPNITNRYHHIYTSRKADNVWLAVTVPDALSAISGELKNIIQEKSFAIAEHGSRPLHVIWKVEREISEKGFSAPIKLVIAMGKSEQEAIKALKSMVDNLEIARENSSLNWKKWLNHGKQIKAKDSRYEKYWNTSLRLLNTAIQRDGSPIMTGFAPYQGNIWVRDSIWMLETLLMVGHEDEALKSLRKLFSIIKKRPDQNYYFAYNCKTEVPNEHSFENDTTGLLLMALGNMIRATGKIDLFEEYNETIEEAVDWIDKNRDATGMILPCAGIWETFGSHLEQENEHMVWASGVSAYGLKTLASVLQDYAIDASYRERLLKIAEELTEAIIRHGVKDNILVRSKETSNLDASALLFFTEMPLFSDRSLFQATVKAIEDRLTDPFLGGLWRHEDLTTELGDMKPWIGPSFWLIEAYYQLGEKEKAVALLHRIMNYSTYCGLFPELMYSANKPRGLGMPSYSQSGYVRTMLLLANDPTNPLGITLHKGSNINE